MPDIQIPSLPAFQPAVTDAGNIGNILMGIAQGISAAPEVRRKQETEKLELESRRSKQRLDQFNTLMQLLQFLPPSKIQEVLPNILSTLTPEFGDKNTETGKAFQEALASFGLGQPAAGAPGSQPPPVPGAPPPPSTGQKIDLTPKSFEEWAAAQGVNAKDLPMFLDKRFRDQYKDYLAEFQRNLTIRQQAISERDRILAMLDKPGTKAILAGPVIEEFNKEYGPVGVTIDKEAAIGQLRENFVIDRTKAIQQEIDKLEAHLDRVTLGGEPILAAQAAAKIQEKIAEAKALGQNLGPGLTPDEAIAAAIHSPAYERREIERERLKLESQRVAIAAQREIRKAKEGKGESHADLRALLTDVRTHITQVTGELKQKNSEISIERKALEDMTPKKIGQFGGETKAQFEARKKSRIDHIAELTKSANELQAILTQLDAQRIGLEKTLVPGFQPVPTPGGPKPAKQHPNSYNVGGKNIPYTTMAASVQSDVQRLGKQKVIDILKKAGIDPADFGLK